MFILHVKHYFFQEILKVHSLQKKMQSQHFITFTSGKLQDFWSSGFGFRQGLRQRSVSREALGPRMAPPKSFIALLESAINEIIALLLTNQIAVICHVYNKSS
jgi:hypothetical protein